MLRGKQLDDRGNLDVKPTEKSEIREFGILPEMPDCILSALGRALGICRDGNV